MITLKLAFRNLIGAGLRTWLTVIVLSVSFVVIILNRGMLEGWNLQARRDLTKWEFAGGQYWHANYDPFDPFTIQDAHGPIPASMQTAAKKGSCAPVLISSATIYPGGRARHILLKGIDPGQHIIDIPTARLATDTVEVPAVIGTRMADNNRLKVGDRLTVQWRDAGGIFDATEIKIVEMFKTNASSVDTRQVWVPLERLSRMLRLPGEASLIIVDRNTSKPENYRGWNFKQIDFLMTDIDQIIEAKKGGGMILYFFLLMLALLAVFNSQVLSIFRRQKEIGTHMALGMTRGQVVGLFTVEGAMYSVLAVLVGALYGVPLLVFLAVKGISMPAGSDEYGLAIAEKIFPTYSVGLVVATVIFVMTATTVASYLPARKIAKMKPFDALKGKMK